MTFKKVTSILKPHEKFCASLESTFIEKSLSMTRLSDKFEEINNLIENFECYGRHDQISILSMLIELNGYEKKMVLNHYSSYLNFLGSFIKRYEEFQVDVEDFHSYVGLYWEKYDNSLMQFVQQSVAEIGTKISELIDNVIFNDSNDNSTKNESRVFFEEYKPMFLSNSESYKFLLETYIKYSDWWNGTLRIFKNYKLLAYLIIPSSLFRYCLSIDAIFLLSEFVRVMGVLVMNKLIEEERCLVEYQAAIQAELKEPYCKIPACGLTENIKQYITMKYIAIPERPQISKVLFT